MDEHPNPRNRADPGLILSTPLPESSTAAAAAAVSATRSLTTNTASPFEPLRSASYPRNRASHSKKNTVLLYDWWLLLAPEVREGRRLSVGGLVAEPYRGSCRHEGDRSGSKSLFSPWQKAERVFESAPITKRYDSSDLGTADGITVRIQGVINKARSRQNGIPLKVNQYPLTRDTANKLCIASPESRNLKRSRSGRLLVLPIAHFACSSNSALVPKDNLCCESESEPPRKRKRLV